MGCDDAAMCSHVSLLMKCLLRWLDYDLVDVAPAPVLTGLERLDDGVAGSMEMFGSVCVLRGVAAANVPANKTLAQVYPAISNFQAILATISARRNFSNLVEVRTIRCHEVFSFFLSLAIMRVVREVKPGDRE